MKRILVNISILTLAVISFFVCVELYLRMGSFGALNEIVIFDRFTGYRLKPDKHITYKSAEYTFDINISRQGLRDGIHDHDKKASGKRVLFIGNIV